MAPLAVVVVAAAGSECSTCQQPDAEYKCQTADHDTEKYICVLCYRRTEGYRQLHEPHAAIFEIPATSTPSPSFGKWRGRPFSFDDLETPGSSKPPSRASSRIGRGAKTSARLGQKLVRSNSRGRKSRQDIRDDDRDPTYGHGDYDAPDESSSTYGGPTLARQTSNELFLDASERLNRYADQLATPEAHELYARSFSEISDSTIRYNEFMQPKVLPGTRPSNRRSSFEVGGNLRTAPAHFHGSHHRLHALSSYQAPTGPPPRSIGMPDNQGRYEQASPQIAHQSDSLHTGRPASSICPPQWNENDLFPEYRSRDYESSPPAYSEHSRSRSRSRAELAKFNPRFLDTDLLDFTQKEVFEDYLAITDERPSKALHELRLAGWNVEVAVSAFFERQENSAAGSQDEDRDRRQEDRGRGRDSRQPAPVPTHRRHSQHRVLSVDTEDYRRSNVPRTERSRRSPRPVSNHDRDRPQVNHRTNGAHNTRRYDLHRMAHLTAGADAAHHSSRAGGARLSHHANRSRSRPRRAQQDDDGFNEALRGFIDLCGILARL